MSIDYVSPDTMKNAVKNSERALFPVRGKCLEGVRVMDGGFVSNSNTYRRRGAARESVLGSCKTDIYVLR